MTEQPLPARDDDMVGDVDPEEIVDALDEDPETPAHRPDRDPEDLEAPQDTDTTDPEEEAAQLSEVNRLDPQHADTPISPGDAVAGAPDAESGQPDVGAAGPNAVPPGNRTGRDNRA